jgi:transcriptional regulator with XRE-family HTH domain
MLQWRCLLSSIGYCTIVHLARQACGRFDRKYHFNMPRVSPLLSKAERQEFGLFLRQARENAGFSVRAAAVALAGKRVQKDNVNRARIGNYETGAVLPTVGVACRLAAIYKIPTLRLLSHAGHTVELLRPIVAMFEVGKGPRRQLFREAGTEFALYAFPRRGEAVSPDAEVALAKLERAFSLIARFDQPRGRLPHAIAPAQAALADSQLTVDARRFIAAEYVHAYVHMMDPQLYAGVCSRIYSKEKPK